MMLGDRRRESRWVCFCGLIGCIERSTESRSVDRSWSVRSCAREAADLRFFHDGGECCARVEGDAVVDGGVAGERLNHGGRNGSRNCKLVKEDWISLG
ncbi:hypothetical protein RYX36_009605 [Vicia faba]